MIDLNPFWEELQHIETGWQQLRDEIEAHAMPAESEAQAFLETLYGLLSLLRKLKRSLREAAEDLREQHKQSDKMPTRESLLAYQRDMGRLKAVHDDVGRLGKVLNNVARRLEPRAGKVTYIYALSEPDTGEVRYIGKADEPSRRLGEHLAHPTNDDMRRWIAELEALGLQPHMEVIEIVTDGDWAQKEARQIWRYREMGFDLLNRDGPD